MSKTRTLWAPGECAKNQPRYPVWSGVIAFPVDLNSIEAFEVLEELCKAQGWELRGVTAETWLSRETLNKHRDTDLPFGPFEEFVEQGDLGNDA